MNVPNFPNVRKVGPCSIPVAALSLNGLARLDYQDAFAIEIPEGVRLTAEDWARLVFRPDSAGDTLLLIAIGLGLGASRPAPQAQGIGAFNVLHATDDAILLEALTRVGLVQIVVACEPSRVVLATFVTYRGPLSRACFELLVRHGHRRAVPHLLNQAGTAAAGLSKATGTRWTA